MFVTYDAFKHALQFDDGSTVSRVVEMLFHAPYFLATVMHEEDDIEFKRNFLLAGDDEVLAFAEHAPLGKLVALQILHSPGESPSGTWSFTPARFLDRQANPPTGLPPLAIITARDGTMYGGHPLAPIDQDWGPLLRLLEFSE